MSRAHLCGNIEDCFLHYQLTVIMSTSQTNGNHVMNDECQINLYTIKLELCSSSLHLHAFEITLFNDCSNVKGYDGGREYIISGFTIK